MSRWLGGRSSMIIKDGDHQSDLDNWWNNRWVITKWSFFAVIVRDMYIIFKRF